MNEMPELRAPEKSRTGIEMRPNVRYPDQTEAAIVSLDIVSEPAAKLAAGQFHARAKKRRVAV